MFDRALLAFVVVALAGCKNPPPPTGAGGPAASPESPRPSGASAAPAASKAAPAAQAARGDVPAAASAVAGANITMNDATVDGLRARELSCKLGGGFLAGTAVIGALSKQKAALNACSPGGEDVRVQFEISGGKATDVRVSASTPAVARCVSDAIAAATIPDKGPCVATLRLAK